MVFPVTRLYLLPSYVCDHELSTEQGDRAALDEKKAQGISCSMVKWKSRKAFLNTICSVPNHAPNYFYLHANFVSYALHNALFGPHAPAKRCKFSSHILIKTLKVYIYIQFAII